MTDTPPVEGPLAHFFTFIDTESGARVTLNTALYHRYPNGRLQGAVIGVIVEPPALQLEPPSENPDAGMGVEADAALGGVEVAIADHVDPPSDTEPT